MTDTIAPADLLPCPFCGERSHLREYDQHAWPIIRCDNCGACGPCTHSTEEKAEAAWQARAAAPQESHPLDGLHINRGSLDAAADAYERDYWAAQAQKKADADEARGALQPVSYYVETIIGAMQAAATQVQQEPSADDCQQLERDLLLFGTSFCVDGKRIHPSRIQIKYAAPQVQQEPVAFSVRYPDGKIVAHAEPYDGPMPPPEHITLLYAAPPEGDPSQPMPGDVG